MLGSFALPELTIERLQEGNGHDRKLLQEDDGLGGSILNVDDDLDTNTTTSAQRSEITGTASFEGPSHDHLCALTSYTR